MKCFYIAVLTLLLVSCAPSVSVTKFTEFEARSNKENVDVYTGRETIKRSFKEVALITIDDEGWDRNESELMTILITKAKELGVDGLIILSQDKQSEGGVFVSGVYIESHRRVVRASAILYDDK